MKLRTSKQTTVTTKPLALKAKIKPTNTLPEGYLSENEKPCPLRPTVTICGYGRHEKYQGCSLPQGHSGLHGHVSSPEIPKTVARKVIETSPIRYNDLLPTLLTDILFAWKALGNPNATALEADLLLFSKGISTQNSIDNPAAVNALVFLGFMVKQEKNPHEIGSVSRYRLSALGLKVTAFTKTVSSAPINMTKPSTEEIDCPICEGTGMDEEGEICNRCKGEGTVKRNKGFDSQIANSMMGGFANKKSASIARMKRPIHLPSQKEDCPTCDGSGLFKGRMCKTCKGEGEI